MNGFDRTWCTFRVVKNYTRGIFATGLRHYFLLNQNIVKYTTAKGKYQDILIEHQ